MYGARLSSGPLGAIIGVVAVLLLSGISGISPASHNPVRGGTAADATPALVKSADPSLKVNGLASTSGPAPETVMVTGSGFPHPSDANLSFYNPAVPTFNLDGSPYPYNTPQRGIVVNVSGDFATEYSVPVAQNGTYKFNATDGAKWATATFKITTPKSSFNYEKFVIRGAPVDAGGVVTLNGTGFYPDDGEYAYLGLANSGFTGTGPGFISLPTFTSELNGNISFRLHIANDTPSGAYTLFVVGATFGYGAAPLPIASSDGAGYFAYNNSFFLVSAVSGTWTQPSVTCPTSGGANASFWVGLDGIVSSSTERIGTLATCSSGTASYSAFWQVTPKSDALHPISSTSVPVAPGDTVTASVSWSSSSSEFELKIKVAGHSFSKKVSQSTIRNTAECMVGAEPPHSGAAASPLADFGEVTFTSCTATIGPVSGPLGSFAETGQSFILSPTEGSLAVPSTFESGYEFFVEWIGPRSG